jgi:hypothetical protein
MGNDVIDYLIYLTSILGTCAIILNIFFLIKLGKSSLNKLGIQVLALMVIFSIAGTLRSYQILFNPESISELKFLEYSIYTLTYITASYSLYSMKEKYGFNVD